MGREASIEGFEPCRDERCQIDEIHPQHEPPKLPECPLCQGALIKMPYKRVRCSGCAWRGKTIEAKKAAQAHA